MAMQQQINNLSSMEAKLIVHSPRKTMVKLIFHQNHKKMYLITTVVTGQEEVDTKEATKLQLYTSIMAFWSHIDGISRPLILLLRWKKQHNYHFRVRYKAILLMISPITF